MTSAVAPGEPPPAPPRRPRLHAVGPSGTPPDVTAPVLVLRRLPQPQPERWSPATRSEDGPPARPPVGPGGRPVGDAQQAFVLHGLPHAVPEPDAGGPVATPSTDLPCPDQLARSLVQAVVDVVRGHRPASQVLRWTTPEVYSQLRQRARLEQAGGRPGGRRPVVRSLRTSPCGPSGIEVSAVVLDGPRARAVAARLDGQDSRWRMTALVIG